MTIRIAQELPTLSGTGAPAAPERPAADGFSAALQARLGSASDNATSDNGGGSARTGATQRRPADRERTVRSTDGDSAPGATAPARGEEPGAAARPAEDPATPVAPTDGQPGAGSTVVPAPVADPQTQAVAAVAAGAAGATGAVGPSTVVPAADQIAQGTPGLGAPGVAPPAGSAPSVASAFVVLADSVPVASPELTVTTQVQQAAVGAALLDPEAAAGGGPVPTVAVTPTVVPAVAPVVPAVAATAAQAGAVDGSAPDPMPVGPIVGVPSRPGDGSAASSGAAQSASTIGSGSSLGAPSAGAPPAAAAGTGADTATGVPPAVAASPAPTTQVGTQPGDGVAVAPNSIGAATGMAAPPALPPTVDPTTTAQAPGAADAAGQDGVRATPVPGTPGVVPVAGDDAPAAPTPLLPDASTVLPEATASQHAVARVVVDNALAGADRAPGGTIAAAAGLSGPAESASTPEPRSSIATAPTTATARLPEQTPSAAPTPPPVVPAPAQPSHAPAVTAASPSAPAQAAAPPPAVHSQILSAVTPALQRRDGSYHIELQLDPASLGRVRVQLAITGGEVSLHLAAGDAATRDLLRQNTDQLRQQLAESGFGKSSVNVGDGGRGNTWQDAQDRQAATAQAGGQGQGGRGGRADEALGTDRPAGPDDEHEDHPHRTAAADADAQLDVRV